MAQLLDRYRVTAEPLRSERRVELLALCLGGVLLLLLLWNALRLATLSAPDAVAPTAESLQVAEIDLPQQVNESQSAELRARPLFWSTRRPQDAPPPVEAAAEEKTAVDKSGNIDKVNLLGVFGGGDSAGIIALVKGKKKRIMVGDTVEGWTLDSIQGDRAVFTRAGSRSELVLKRKAAG